MSIFRSLGQALLVSTLLCLAACGEEQQALAPASEAREEATMATVEGEVFYRERIMIPPDSEVEVQLEDISRADALATVLESVSFKAQGGPPYAFSIEYDPTRIDKRMRYALRARITSPEGDLLFTNTEYIDPFGGAPVRIMVQGMARPDPAPAPGSSTPDRDKAAAQPSDGAMVWVLSTLQGQAAPAGADGKPLDLRMSAADRTVSGFSGCNRYSGSFSSEGRSTHGTPIKFGPLAGTMMACAEGGELEQAYLQMLGRVDGYRMQGGELVLLSGGQAVATFKSR
jgi:putative lipoprotein